MRADIGPFAVDDFADAIRFLYNGGSTECSTREVDPRFVLAQAWQVGRLESARRRIGRGIVDDPIRLGGVRLPGLPELYTVSDGMHRSVAARFAGRTTIRAVVSGHRLADPAGAYIRDRTLYFTRPGGDGHLKRPVTVDRKVLEILRGIGVVDRTPLVARLSEHGATWLRRALR